MEQEFLTNLPTEIMIDILSILPTPSIMRCKCVCKSWRDLIKTREFVESHFSRSGSVPCIALPTTLFTNTYKIIEFIDTQSSGQNCYCNTILNFSFPHEARIYSSANGLLFLSNIDAGDLFICNPITHEYIKLPSPVLKLSVLDVFGFGASKLSGEYKFVRLFYEGNRRTRKCEVYSIRRGSWRSVETAGDQLRDAHKMSSAIYLNENLHWLVGEYNQFRGILCFDLETECFSTFSIPRLLYLHHIKMCALGGCLCLYDASHEGTVVLWLMNKYGDAKSWTKEFIIEKRGVSYLGDVVPIKFSKDGVVLFVRRQFSCVLRYYSSKTKTIQEIDGAAKCFVEDGTTPCIYTPSFVPLKILTVENNVISF